MDSNQGTTVEKKCGQAFIFTTVARNYLSQAAVLFDSIKTYCEDAPFRCFIVDGYDDSGEIPEPLRDHVFDCRRLGVPRFEEMAFKYSVTEFATSLKPHIFNHIFDHEGHDCAIFLDPDTKLYCNTDWVEHELKLKSILVTPHVLKQEPYMSDYSGTKPYFDMSKLLFAGIYNTGFIAIRNDTHGRAFTGLWSEILRDRCLHKFCYDQKWIELVPNFFGDQFGMINDPGAIVAYWNLHERSLTRDAQSNYWVDGSRLKFMHFSKIYRVRDIWKWDGSERDHIKNPQYSGLYREYLDELKKAGLHEGQGRPIYRYNYFDNGVPVNMVHRRIYAKMISEEEVPNPFSGSGKLYATLDSEGMLERGSDSGLFGARVLLKVINGLLSSKMVYRLLYRILGSKKYLSLLKRLARNSDIDANVSLMRVTSK